MPDTTKTSNITLSELYAAEGKAELVQGNLVQMLHTGTLPGIEAGVFFPVMKVFEEVHATGEVDGTSQDSPAWLTHRRSFAELTLTGGVSPIEDLFPAKKHWKVRAV